MKDPQSIYLEFYRVALRDIQTLIDSKMSALDDCAKKLQSDISGSGLNDALKRRDDLEVLRATSTQLLGDIREVIDARYAAFAKTHSTQS